MYKFEKSVTESVTSLKNSLNFVNAVVGELTGRFTILSGAIKQTTEAVKKLNYAFSQSSFENSVMQITKLGNSINTLTPSLIKLQEEQKKSSDSMAIYRDTLENVNTSLGNLLLGRMRIIPEMFGLTGENAVKAAAGIMYLAGKIYEAATLIAVFKTLFEGTWNKWVIPAILSAKNAIVSFAVNSVRSLTAVIGQATALGRVLTGLRVLGAAGIMLSIGLAVGHLVSPSSNPKYLDDPKNKQIVDESELRSKAIEKLNKQFSVNYTSEKLKGSKNLPFDEEDIKIMMGVVKQEEKIGQTLEQQYETKKKTNELGKDLNFSPFLINNFNNDISSFSNGFDQEKNAIDALITGISREVRWRELRNKLDVIFLNQQIDKLKNEDSENLVLDERIKLWEKIRELEKNSVFDMHLPDAKTSEDIQKIIDNMPGIIRRNSSPFLNQLTPREKKQHEFEQEQEIARLDAERLQYAQGMWSNFQGMLQSTGLMKGQFGEIINFINSFLNSISSGVSFVDSLIGFFSSFIPGGSVIAGIASGGGAMPGIGGMPNIGRLSSYNTYQTLNAARSSSSSRLNQASVNISGELRLKGKDAVYVYDRNKAIQTSLIN
jgi:hypothetical protein